MFNDDEITEVTEKTKTLRERFVAETTEFLKQYMKIKAVPDASQPVNIDEMLADFDRTIAKEGR